MTIENQVSGLELSKRLKELGVKQESYFVWIDSLKGLDSVVARVDNPHETRILCSAFTVAELGEMLPIFINGMPIRHRQGGTTIEHRDGDGQLVWGTEMEKTEADARAKMLIYLLEKGLISEKSI